MTAGLCYHVINRGNARCVVFHDAADCDVSCGLCVRARGIAEVDLLAYCLMPNHVHFILRPRTNVAVSRWMHWVAASHVHRHRRRHGGSGHLWRGRFKAFPIQEDIHLLAVARYVEANALRAGLVAGAEQWPWGSLAMRGAATGTPPLAELPLPLPANWIEIVNTSAALHETDAVRLSINRGTPFGHAGWVETTARNLGLLHTLRSRGRPPHPGDEKRGGISAECAMLRNAGTVSMCRSHRPSAPRVEPTMSARYRDLRHALA